LSRVLCVRAMCSLPVPLLKKVRNLVQKLPVLLYAWHGCRYSCYDGDCESTPTSARKVLILGGGPNRIGQVRRMSDRAEPSL
jgi:hypothetical protein